MKLLAMHITNHKLSFDIFTVDHLQNIFMEHDLNILMIFGIKEKLILTHIMYFWLLLQIFPSDLWLLLCSRVTYVENICEQSVNTDTKAILVYSRPDWSWNTFNVRLRRWVIVVKPTWPVFALVLRLWSSSASHSVVLNMHIVRSPVVRGSICSWSLSSFVKVQMACSVSLCYKG